MEILASLLSPLIWVMDRVLNAGTSISGSAGFAILMLSVISSLSLYPLQRWAYHVENRFLDKHGDVQSKVQTIAPELKGEDRFLAEEKIYKECRYHPIQQICLSMSIVVVLPVLIAAIFLFDNHPALQGVGFGFIPDLGDQDHILKGVNLLPILMFVFTFIDAFVRFRQNRSTFIRFLVVSIVLVFLVYRLPAALILYWIGNNVISMALYQWKRKANV